MLIVSGNHPQLRNGDMLDSAQVSAAELSKALNVDMSVTWAEFRLMPVHQSVKQDGQRHFLRGFSLSAAYVIEHGAGSLQIRFCISRRMENQQWRYTNVNPYNKMEEFQRVEILGLNPQKFPELYLWYMLHPGNDKNPYRNQSRPAMFYFYDREMEAGMRVQQNIALMDVLKEIMNMDYTSLKIMSAGMRYKVNNEDRMVARVNEAGEEELRSALWQMANQDQMAFVNAFKSGANTIVGMLRHAVDGGMIELITQSWGNSWVWRTPAHDGTVICGVQPKADNFGSLQDAFMANHQSLMPMLHDALKMERVETIAEKMDLQLVPKEAMTLEYIKTLSLEDVFQQAIVGDVLAYDRGLNAVYFVRDGAFDGDPIPVSVNPKTWQADLLEHLKNNGEAREELAYRVFEYIQAESANRPAEGAPAAPPKPNGRFQKKPVPSDFPPNP